MTIYQSRHRQTGHLTPPREFMSLAILDAFVRGWWDAEMVVGV